MTNEKGRIDKNCVGRFAPTPSGEMHAGNLLCAFLAYLSVKSRGGKFLVRIEDLDAARCPRSSAQKILHTLHRLGMDSDEPPLWQSERTNFYSEKEKALRSVARVYPCFCTRAQLHTARAPRMSDGGVLYNGACRNLTREQTERLRALHSPCERVAVPDCDVTFTDGIAGNVTQNLARECGDFILRRSDGVYAYQFAVAADDGESGVTEVVRGADLLSSAPRQIWLMQLLGYAPPVYYHIPLVCDASGRKLSKSEGDSAMRLVERMPPESILGALAFAAGLTQKEKPASLNELVREFSWNKVHKDTILLPPSLCQP